MNSARLGRAWLLIRLQIRAIFFGPAHKVPLEIQRVIVVPSGKLGDVVCCTPVLVAIRKHLSKAKIIVAGNSKLHRELLAYSNLADEYLDLNEKNAIARIKNCEAQVAIVTGPDFQSAAEFYLAGIPLVIGPRAVGREAGDMTRSYKKIQKYITTFPHDIRKYAPRERLKALELIGIKTSDTTKVLGFSDDARKSAEDLISKIPGDYKYLVGISCGAGNKEKQWSPKHFGEVANYLIDNHNAHIVLFGGKNDVSESNEMMLAVKDKLKITDSTVISTEELKARISKLDLFISVNTGPLYIAEAFDIPTVDILGPVNPYDQPPQGKIHKMVFPPDGPQTMLSIMNTRNHDIKEAERIAQSTRLDDVITATEEVLAEVNRKMLLK